MRKRQNGFAAVEILVLVPLVIVLAVVAVKVYRSGHQAEPTATKTTTTESAKPIQTTTDLDQAGTELDQVDLEADSSVETEIAAQAATF